jgi:hypothetical protein
MPTFRNTLSVPCRWNWQGVPKRRHINFRRRWITQKKGYNIQNMGKFWNPEEISVKVIMFISIIKPTWCTFHSIYWESRASTCFEQYLLILRRCYTNGIWYIACVLCQLAVTRLQFHCLIVTFIRILNCLVLFWFIRFSSLLAVSCFAPGNLQNLCAYVRPYFISGLVRCRITYFVCFSMLLVQLTLRSMILSEC